MWKHAPSAGRAAGLVITLLVSACAEQAETQPAPALSCAPPQVTGNLPADIKEASGVAASLRQPGLWWMLIDEKPPVLTAIDSTGRVLAQLAIDGAQVHDWESLASAPCQGGACLYIGDLGDNERRREKLSVYRVLEPATLGDTRVGAVRFDFQYPNARYDAEAMFILPGEQLYVVTKGRGEPVTLFRYPGALDSTRTVVLERVQQLSQGLVQFPEMVTGGGATPDGQWIVLRTYAALQLFRMENGFLLPQLPAGGLELTALQQTQGEGVDIRSDGTVLLLTEQGISGAGRTPIGMVRCAVRSAGAPRAE